MIELAGVRRRRKALGVDHQAQAGFRGAGSEHAQNELGWKSFEERCGRRNLRRKLLWFCRSAGTRICNPAKFFAVAANGYLLKDGPARHLFEAINYVLDGGQSICLP